MRVRLAHCMAAPCNLRVVCRRPFTLLVLLVLLNVALTSAAPLLTATLVRQDDDDNSPPQTPMTTTPAKGTSSLNQTGSTSTSTQSTISSPITTTSTANNATTSTANNATTSTVNDATTSTATNATTSTATNATTTTPAITLPPVTTVPTFLPLPTPATSAPSASPSTTTTPLPAKSPSPPTNGSTNTNVEPRPATESSAPGDDPTLSRPVLIAISVSAAVAFVIALALVVLVVQRRRPARRNDSYYRFTDAAASGNGSALAPGPNVADTAKPPLPPPRGAETPPAIVVASVDPDVGRRHGASPGDLPTQPPQQSRFLSAVGQAERAGLEGASVSMDRPTQSTVSSLAPPDPTAPSASQFSRRDSDISSGSSDTIVAPLYGNDSVSTSAAAPWFHTGRPETPPSR